jgi:hypothetical protein
VRQTANLECCNLEVSITSQKNRVKYKLHRPECLQADKLSARFNSHYELLCFGFVADFQCLEQTFKIRPLKGIKIYQILGKHCRYFRVNAVHSPSKFPRSTLNRRYACGFRDYVRILFHKNYAGSEEKKS